MELANRRGSDFARSEFARDDEPYRYHVPFYKAGTHTLKAFIKQYFRKSQDASELAFTPEDEA